MRGSRNLSTGLVVLKLGLFGAGASAQVVFPAAVGRAPMLDPSEPAVLLRAGLGLQSIDNITAVSTGAESDLITTTTLGASVRKAFSRQQFLLDASINDNQYQSHPELNYAGNTLNGAWQWASGSSLFGSFSGNRTVSQNAIGTSVNTSQRNLNTSQTSTALIGYELSGAWQVSTGLIQSSSVNEQQVYGQAIASEYHGGFVGGTYTASSGNTIALRTFSGYGSNTLDFAVQSTELSVNTVSAQDTTTSAQISYWQQSYAAQPIYDFSGWMGRYDVNWKLTEKTAVGWTLQRQLFGIPQANASYTVNDSVSLVPSWQMAPKIALRGTVQLLTIRYLGDFGAGNSGEVDRFQTIGAALSWRPLDLSELTFGVTSSKRTTSLNDSIVYINTVSLMGMIAF